MSEVLPWETSRDLFEVGISGGAFCKNEGGGGHSLLSQAHTSTRISKMSSVMFVCANKLLCNFYSFRCVRNKLMTMQEEAVV